MKVKCIKINNCNGSLTLNKEYVVLEINVILGKEILYRVITDSSNVSPALFDSRQFEVISKRIPSNWTIFEFNDGFDLCPESWQKPSFWEDCYDGISDALEIYKHEARIIMEEEGFL